LEDDSYNGEKDTVHIILKSPETRRLREHLLSRKWQIIKEVAYKKIINCANIVELRDLGRYRIQLNVK
jgi:hypothetical protein